MKRLFATLFFIFCASAAVAESGGGWGKWYDKQMGLYLVRSNLTMHLTRSAPQSLEFNDWGLGFSWGKKYGNIFVMEFDGEFRQLSVSAGSESDELWNIVVFGGGRAQMDVPGAEIHPELSWLRFRPYAGIGIGPSLWINDAIYMYTTYPGGYRLYHAETTMKTGLAWQIKFGLAVPVSDRFDVDAGIRYQRLGRPGNSGAEFDMLGEVRNTEYRLGALYKY
jgi:opacity protein-like surface antigen